MLLKKEKVNKKNSKSQLFVVGSLLIILSIGLFSFDRLSYFHKINNEKKEIKTFYEKQEIIDNNETDTINDNNNSTNKGKSVNSKYIAVLKIPKINLEKGLVSKDDKNNKVNKNIQILKESNMPDETNGNVILAAHSGTSRVAFFKNLYKLDLNDEIYITYKGYTYTYKIVNIYDIEKTGKANIIRNKEKSTLTLISCRQKTNKQIIVISELIERDDYNKEV